MPTLTPELVELDRQFAAAKAAASELVGPLNYAQFNWRPGPLGWSIAECLLHLNIVGHRYVRLIEPALDQARARGLIGSGPFAHGMLGKWILSNTEPPPKRKFKAGRSFIPPDDQPITAVLPTFAHLQEQLSQQLAQASGLDLARVKVRAPGMPLRFNLLLTFAWIAAHERRHLWQACQVRSHPGFPA